jgi:hypothetical protein
MVYPSPKILQSEYQIFHFMHVLFCNDKVIFNDSEGLILARGLHYLELRESAETRGFQHSVTPPFSKWRMIERLKRISVTNRKHLGPLVF